MTGAACCGRVPARRRGPARSRGQHFEDHAARDPGVVLRHPGPEGAGRGGLVDAIGAPDGRGVARCDRVRIRFQAWIDV